MSSTRSTGNKSTMFQKEDHQKTDIKGPDWHSHPNVDLAQDISAFDASFTEAASFVDQKTGVKPKSEVDPAQLYRDGPNTFKISETGDHKLDRKQALAILNWNKNADDVDIHHAPTTGVMQVVYSDGHKAAHKLDRKGSAAVTRAHIKTFRGNSGDT